MTGKNKRLSSLWLGAVSGLALLAQPALAQDKAGPASVKPYDPSWGFNMAGMDTAIKPGNNFFLYANGTYLKNIVIPPDRSSFGPFVILAETARERVQSILRDARKNPSADPKTTEEKLGAYYSTFLDTARADKLGASPLKTDLETIRNEHDAASLARIFAAAQSGFHFSPFMLMINADDKDPTHYALMLHQADLGLPDRDYYLKPEFASKKKAYQAYVDRILTLTGWANPSVNAGKVVAFETKLAEAQWSRTALRDPVKTYNPMTVDELAKRVPGIDWTAYLVAAGIPSDNIGARRIVVGEPSALAGMAKVIVEADPAVVKAWLAFHLGNNAARYLSHDFVQAAFDFNDHELEGQPELPARWKQAVGRTEDAMGWAIGKIYVHRYFPPEAKARITALTQDVKAAFGRRLTHVAWMAPETRKAAERKLQNFEIQVGYPNKWRSYDGLVVKPGDLYGNGARAFAFEWKYQLGHLDKAVDRNEWFMTPQTVNAYNDPNQVEIVFPAAILQPPFFDPKGDTAVNYGGIGGVIGHEMTHSFDDQGRQYDEHGRLHQWWTPDDVKRFQALADKFGKQYDAFEVLPGTHLNGKLTMGENIADLGGLTLALDAYHASLHGKPAPVVHGLTGDQRVFLGWAQVWRQKLREDSIRKRAVTDPHSAPEARVNIPMHNIDAWYAAFGVKPGDKLYLSPEDRVKIW
ncbi:M13 family metallopeptidase [Swaminathania salitolerans]|uniref:Zinc metalloprotease n=1 Tax=Swaminathania salitolerans TaxID=182838 RepID=A0A511BS41_9PROT|nr:metallopeptidase [Swaminathania salitolerans LMG 21291]GEL03105.1 zinc metalloprotease [Swaminathania salitolerans]